MNYKVYIIYSDTVHKYYTGMTSLQMEERLAYYNYTNKSFTNQAEDWRVVLEKEFEDKKLALQFEKKIKKRGAKRFLDSQVG